MMMIDLVEKLDLFEGVPHVKIRKIIKRIKIVSESSCEEEGCLRDDGDGVAEVMKAQRVDGGGVDEDGALVDLSESKETVDQ